MTTFLNETLIDIRRGRESWRIFVAFGAPSFVIGICAATLQLLV